MDREGIRRLAAEELKLPTSAYRFAETEAEYRAAVEAVGCAEPLLRMKDVSLFQRITVKSNFESWRILRKTPDSAVRFRTARTFTPQRLLRFLKSLSVR